VSHDRLAILSALPPHELLGVPRDAPLETIRSAYRVKARLYHPDRLHPFMARYGEEVVRLLNRAYEQMRRDAR
jgi:curved DNA-binding protein CbpA